MLTLTPPRKTMKLSKFQFILTYALRGPDSPRIWLFIPRTYENKLISLNRKDALNSGRDSEKIM